MLLAGADIGKFPAMLGDPAASAQYARDCAMVQTFMDQMGKSVVTALNGFALGGGLEAAKEGISAFLERRKPEFKK
jgi:enoyl-CoA hydratase/carnithine racemase